MNDHFMPGTMQGLNFWKLSSKIKKYYFLNKNQQKIKIISLKTGFIDKKKKNIYN